MGGCLYIIISNHSFDCVYAIQLHHFEQLKSGKKLWGNQLRALPL